MKSKGFKIIVGALVAAIVVLSGLLLAKNIGPAGDPASTAAGNVVSEGAIADDSSLPLPSGGIEITEGSGSGDAA